jgi:hypothetical protein
MNKEFITGRRGMRTPARQERAPRGEGQVITGSVRRTKRSSKFQVPKSKSRRGGTNFKFQPGNSRRSQDLQCDFFECGVPSVLDSLVPARSALAGFWLRPDSFRHVGSFTPVQSALRPSLFANPFRNFPSCSNPGGSSRYISPISWFAGTAGRVEDFQSAVISVISSTFLTCMSSRAQRVLGNLGAVRVMPRVGWMKLRRIFMASGGVSNKLSPCKFLTCCWSSGFDKL